MDRDGELTERIMPSETACNPPFIQVVIKGKAIHGRIDFATVVVSEAYSFSKLGKRKRDL